MTALEPEVPVEAPIRLWVDEGVLCARCADCDVYLELAAGGDEAQARRSFLQAHAPGGDPAHVVAVPTGWWQPLSGPGAFSQ